MYGVTACLVTRTHHVATCEPVALEVKAARAAAPALVSVLSGHVSGLPHVAVSQTHLVYSGKKKKERENKRGSRASCSH